MPGFFDTKQTIQPHAVMDTEDIFKTKHALWRLGVFDPPSYGVTDLADDDLIKSVQAFQKSRGLVVDGILKPGHSTAGHIDAELERQHLTNAPPRALGLGQAVGTFEAPNRPDDVARVQGALLQAGVPLPGGGVDGRMTPELGDLLKTAQKALGVPDSGRIQPGDGAERAIAQRVEEKKKDAARRAKLTPAARAREDMPNPLALPKVSLAPREADAAGKPSGILDGADDGFEEFLATTVQGGAAGAANVTGGIRGLGANNVIVRKAYEKAIEGVRAEAEAKVKSGKMTVEQAAKWAQKTRGDVIEKSRKDSTALARALAEKMKPANTSLNELQRRKSPSPEKSFVDLTRKERSKMFSDIMESSGRSNNTILERAWKLTHAARRLWVISAAVGIYNVLESEDKLRTVMREGAKFAGGAAAGAVSGAKAGALGGSLAGPVGTVAGVVIGSIVGGIAGAVGAGFAFDEIEELFEDDGRN